MNIQIISWRDPKNPKAGGAEVCLKQLARRLIGTYGHTVRWFAPRFSGASDRDLVDGITIERRGRTALVHLTTFLKFFRARAQTADFYIEDYHGATLMTALYISKPGAVLVHEVAGKIWFEMFRAPLAIIGFLAEKIMLRLIRHKHFITVSESTKRDLVASGVDPARIHVFTEASDLPPAGSPLARSQREPQFVFIGRICKMKRVDLLLRCFAKLREKEPSLNLVLTGSMDSDFRDEFNFLMDELTLGTSVRCTGFVSQEEKAAILQKSLALVSCSMHEGFGLVVVEANSQGTPAITFDVHGYRDLIRNGVNGELVEFGAIDAMADAMRRLAKASASDYERLAVSSIAAVKDLSWDRSGEQFNDIIETIKAEFTAG